jgi:uncharacterized protein YkwD
MHRSTRLAGHACTILALAAGVLAAAREPATAGSLNTAEQELAETINDYRAGHEAARLCIDPRLMRAAERTSSAMARHDFFGHVDPWGRDPFDRMAAAGYPTDTWRGENLAAGQAAPRRTFQQFRRSPRHDALQRSRRFHAVGIARSSNATSTYGHYWAVEFGSRCGR